MIIKKIRTTILAFIFVNDAEDGRGTIISSINTEFLQKGQTGFVFNHSNKHVE